MPKLKVVTFDKDGGWVLINPEESEYSKDTYVVNPDLTAVSGLPPEQWRLLNGKVVPAEGINNISTPGSKLTELLKTAEDQYRVKKEISSLTRKLKILLIIQGLVILTIVISKLTGVI